jgi:hypothetical protein
MANRKDKGNQNEASKDRILKDFIHLRGAALSDSAFGADSGREPVE